MIGDIVAALFIFYIVIPTVLAAVLYTVAWFLGLFIPAPSRR